MGDQRIAAAVMAALEKVVNPRTGDSVIAGGHIQGIDVGDDGKVSFQFLLGPEDSGTLVREVRSAAEAVPGIGRVKIDVRLPTAAPEQQRRGGRQLKPGSVPAPVPEPSLVSNIRHVIAVSSGKGGVGKSTVAVNLAARFAALGMRVGLLDADVYGPDVPLMFGEKRRPQVSGERGKEKLVPLEAHGVKLMSLGFLLEDDQPAIMRGPLVSGVLKQFLEQVDWGSLDWLVVDMPPGTGDAQLSLVQTVNVDGAVLVTTPQEVSTGDVRRAVRMFERVRTRVLGIVENMSGLACPHCGTEIDVFGTGGGQRLAESLNVPFLGSIPLDPAVRIGGDAGLPTVIAPGDTSAARAFAKVAEKVATSLGDGRARNPGE